MFNTMQEYKPPKAILFHDSIRFHPKLTFGEKVFLAEIKSMSENGRCPFSSRTLSKFFGVSHQTILNWVKKLVDMELLEVGIDYKNNDCKQFLKIRDNLQ